MKAGIATVSIAGDLPEKLAAIAAAGFDGVEIFEQDFIAHDGGPAEVGRMVRDHGLEIMLFQPFADGFFFEIVERRRGYRGYGAADAPCRIAALKRLMKVKAAA